MASEGTAIMQFGIHLGSVKLKYWGDVAEEADRLGFHAVHVPEHVIVPIESTGSPHHGDEHPPIPSDIPIPDALGMLCHLAARTEHIRLATNVYNIGLRHPFLTARAAMTVDVLSSGRLDLGIGASWLRSEWEAMGLDFDTRGARVDETIEICQRLWTADVIEHHGRFFDFGPTSFEPKPVQQPLPLHIGGDGPAALRRAATVGAGWMPMNHSLGDLPASALHLRQLAEDAGRQAPIQITTYGAVTSPGDVEEYADAGVTQLIVTPWASSRDAIDGLRAFADRLLST
jgi:probable F420-dependent oxidoreductase